MPWDHTVLPATRQRWHSRRYPSRSWYSIKRPRRDARLSWPSWLITTRRRSSIPVVTGPTCVNFVHWRTPLTTTPRCQPPWSSLDGKCYMVVTAIVGGHSAQCGGRLLWDAVAGKRADTGGRPRRTELHCSMTLDDSGTWAVATSHQVLPGQVTW